MFSEVTSILHLCGVSKDLSFVNPFHSVVNLSVENPSGKPGQGLKGNLVTNKGKIYLGVDKKHRQLKAFSVSLTRTNCGQYGRIFKYCHDSVMNRLSGQFH